MIKATIRIIIVDDSRIARTLMIQGLSAYPEIEVIAEAADAYEARDLIVKLKPDLITLDLDMPKMGGLEFISVLMKHWPLPIVVVSGTTNSSDDIKQKALSLGAVGVVEKPGTNQVPSFISTLCQTIKQAVNFPTLSNATLHQRSDYVIAIGASTGGTEAIQNVLSPLPANLPGIVIVQHMPKSFTGAFAERLNNHSALTVKEASEGDLIQPGVALVAPGDQHLVIVKKGEHYYAHLTSEDPVCRHRPSVDVLFQSVAEQAGKKALGILLTGMGRDGAQGMLAMSIEGAHTIAQDQESSAIYGMPKEAALMGGVREVLPLTEIPAAICRW